MSKSEWLEAWARTKSAEVKVVVEGVAWAGFWIGLGIIIAAAIMKGQLVLK